MRTQALLIGLTFAAGSMLGAPAIAQDPYSRADDTWIVIEGTVDAVSANSFILDYGKGVVTVEMDDGDRDADGYKLLPGDKVSVSGRIDDDFFETTTIEASSVYVEKLGTTFYASAVDEEDWGYMPATALVVVSRTTVRGKVSEVGDEEFTVDLGPRKLTVETDAMPYDPLDDEGYLKVRKGDRVSVTGRMDYDLFEGRELVADSIVKLVGREAESAAKPGNGGGR